MISTYPMSGFGRVFAPMQAMRPIMAMARFLFVFALALHCAGCKEQLAKFLPKGRASGDATASVKPGRGEQVCFDCAGKGHVRCGAGGCQNGQTECPAPCLKLSRGKWEHMTVPGHAAHELWQKFPKPGGGFDAWNDHHVGEVVRTERGISRNVGKCTTCQGTTKVQCTKCAGKGTQSCFVCDGKAVVPAGWTSTDNPRLNNHPDLIRLRDGRSFIGRIAMQSGAFCTIRTRDGKMIDVNSADIVSEKP
jgi:hypothetical protein